MDKFKMEHLLKNHAYWADRVTEMRRQTRDHLDNCVRLLPDLNESGEAVSLISTNNCIEECILLTQEEGNELSFEEHWEDMVADGQACVACRKAREAKAERVKASIRLGQVRSAITKAGRKIARERDWGHDT